MTPAAEDIWAGSTPSRPAMAVDPRPEAPTFEQFFAALEHSHERLGAVLGSLHPDQVRAGSYCREWSIAQVASHLGSGADIFGLLVEAGLRGETAPTPDQLPPIWERWNAKSPDDQVRHALVADAALLERLGGLSDDERRQWHLHVFGSDRRIVDVARMRLNELALHTWDIVVSFDPRARVEGDAVQLIVESVEELVAYLGKPVTEERRVQVETASPRRQFLLDLSPQGVQLAAEGAGRAEVTGRLRLPAEAFVRLVYGRLDADHTPPSVTTHGVELDVLRRAFSRP